MSPDSPDECAKRTEEQMTDDERFSLLISMIGPLPLIGLARDARIPDGVDNLSAGYTPGVPRLGVPALQSSDASMGVANPGFRPHDPGATAFPCTLLVGATFNPDLARAQGAAIGREARSRGFNVLLAGGVNLARDPRNGRNFEYYGEDPLLAGVMAAEAVRGTQSEGVISTLKHFTLNCNETNRHWLDAVIEPAAHRESDLLAFQIAVERAEPGAIMSAYNKVNGVYASGHHHLLNEVLKGSWGFAGYVMSDWGAAPEWEYALAGLDQESGVQIDVMLWGSEGFTHKLRAAYAEGKLPKARLSEMVRRMLRSIYAVGADRWGPAPEVDLAKHRETALETARQGIVLLKNEGVLPLATDRALKIAVIGGFAQEGVATGTGSAAVQPIGGYAGVVKIGGTGMMGGSRNLYLLPPSPLAELKRLLPQAQVEFDAGYTPAEAVLLARRSDVAIVFGVRAEGEGYDSADLSLPWGQDAVIDAVASENPNTIVVLETGNPVSMPWRGKVKA
ncbi:MAG TPA: glycoside hydrolase family 3 protein, partial [Polyangiaceae bacterium]